MTSFVSLLFILIKLKIPFIFLSPCLLLFYNKIVTGEPANTTSKERDTRQIFFLSECMPQLSISET